MKIWIGMLVLVTGCTRAPMLRDAWRPDPNAMALGAAATAMLLLVTDLDGYQRMIEQPYLDATPIPRPMRVTEVVPSDVLDRLDAIQTRTASR